MAIVLQIRAIVALDRYLCHRIGADLVADVKFMGQVWEERCFFSGVAQALIRIVM